MKKLDINSITQVWLPETQYYQEKQRKNQIVLHHTAGSSSVEGVLAWWKKTPARIGTAFIIDRSGIIYQCFHSSYWAHHLGTKRKNNTILNKQSIGIELCCWGSLTKKYDYFMSYKGKQIPREDVIYYDESFRDCHYYQSYTLNQIESLRLLILYLSNKYKIPMDFHSNMWNLSSAALSETPGIFSHVSFRSDKSDCHPQSELVEMLLNLKSDNDTE